MVNDIVHVHAHVLSQAFAFELTGYKPVRLLNMYAMIAIRLNE